MSLLFRQPWELHPGQCRSWREGCPGKKEAGKHVHCPEPAGPALRMWKMAPSVAGIIYSTLLRLSSALSPLLGKKAFVPLVPSRLLRGHGSSCLKAASCCCREWASVSSAVGTTFCLPFGEKMWLVPWVIFLGFRLSCFRQQLPPLQAVCGFLWHLSLGQSTTYSKLVGPCGTT